MKKTIQFFAVLVVMMGFALGAWAQSATSGDVTANATVQSQLVVTEQQDLDFGSVVNIESQTKTISCLGVATSSGGAPGQTGVHQGIGKIVRTGTNTSITYKLTSPPAHLDGTDGSELPIATYVTAYNFDGSTSGQTAGNATVTSDTEVTTGGNNIYVHIGATVTATAATTQNGLHTGEITLSAEYN